MIVTNGEYMLAYFLNKSFHIIVALLFNWNQPNKLKNFCLFSKILKFCHFKLPCDYQ